MATPTLDGHAHGVKSTGADLTLTLTTSLTNDVIVVQVYNELNAGAAAVSSVVAASGVTAFTKRARSNGSTNGSLEVWWGVAAAALAGVVITVHFAATYDDASAVAFGVNGCKTPASPWDSNVGLPFKASWTANGSTAQITGVNTSQADDFLIAPVGAVSGTGFGLGATGFTFIDSAPNGGGTFVSNLDAAYLRVSAKQSSLTVTQPGTLSNAGATSVGGEMMVDALTGDATATPTNGFFHNGFTALPSPGLAAALLGIGAVRRNKVITRRALLGRG